MPSRKATTWLQLHRNNEQFILSCTQRHENLLNDLSNPSTQTPSLNLLLGKQSKNAFLTNLFPNSVHRLGPYPHSINLTLDSETQYHQSPIFIADCDLDSNTCVQSDDAHPNHIGFSWAEVVEPTSPSALVFRCIAGFCDSVWIFTDDYGGVTKTKKILTEWSRHRLRSAYPTSLKPQLIVVYSDYYAQQDTISFEEEEYEEMFSSIYMCHIPKQEIAHQYEIFHKQLNNVVETCQRKRASSYTLFSAVHQQVLIKEAICHLSRNVDDTFDLIKTTRRSLAQTEMTPHIEEFLQLAAGSRPPYSIISDYLASCFLIDAYPPRMHVFGPRMLFKSIYLASCLSASRTAFKDYEAAEFFCANVEKSFSSHAAAIISGQTALSLRKSVIQSTGRYWIFRSNHSCFSCFRRMPDYTLPCGHCICEVCVDIFGRGTIGSELDLMIEDCPICGKAASIVLTSKPKTAAPRVLSIDGGGSRGVIPIESLLLLQESLGPDCPIQEFFDFAIGTSAGGLIVLGLFLRGLTVDQSKETFKSMTKKFFHSARVQDKTLMGQCRRLVKSMLNDYIYDVKDLEEALIALFGADTKLFGYNPLSQSGVKVAVTAATDDLPTARLFTNYNGRELSNDDCGYRIERARTPEDEPTTWQTARATSAVPVLFPSIHIPQLGTYWDGAFARHNNPINLALWESKRLWPGNFEPDVVVSLGTGVKSKDEVQRRGLWDIIQSRGVPKMWSSLMSFLEGEEPWRDLTNRLDNKTKDDYFRFNIPIPGSLPALDDTAAMDSLSASLRFVAEGGAGTRDALTALLVSCFFFELACSPTRYSEGIYYATGYVRCRSNQPRSIIRTLYKLHAPDIRIFNGCKDLGVFLTENDVCSTCLRYSSRVEILTRSLDEPLELLMNWQHQGSSFSRRLSSMPKSFSWFIKMQQLHSPFGAANHGVPGRIPCPACVAPLPARGTVEPYSRSRKRRIDTVKVDSRKKVRSPSPIPE